MSSSGEVEEEAALTETVTWILRSLNCRKTWSPSEQPANKVETQIRACWEAESPSPSSKAFCKENKDGTARENSYLRSS